MNKLRFVMVGGFLGAGKTTTLARLARHHLDQGEKIGLVTNDQASDLVDTTSLRSQGFPVQEVPGACFCCQFDNLVEKMGQLEADERPDVILAEPVGSCTDLVATVVQPMRDLYGDRFEIAPFSVLFKPSHGLRILEAKDDKPGGFSPKAAYIFRKQLEEADVIVINHIDELPAEKLDRLTELVEAEYPGTPILKMSAKTGEGFDHLPEFLSQSGNFGRKILDIDYDIYAEGEAELGWLNSSIALTRSAPFVVDELLLEVVGQIRAALDDDAEVAHLKAIGLSDLSFGVANLTSSDGTPSLSLSAQGDVSELNLIVNARVATDPAILENVVRNVVAEVCGSRNIDFDFRTMQSFRPGRPEPTHRYSSADGS